MAGAAQPALDRAFGEPAFGRDLAHRLFVEVERFQELGVRAAESGQSPSDDGGRVGAPGGKRLRLDLDERWIERLRRQTPEVADQRIARHTHQPGRRIGGYALLRPVCKCCGKSILHGVFHKFQMRHAQPPQKHGGEFTMLASEQRRRVRLHIARSVHA